MEDVIRIERVIPIDAPAAEGWDSPSVAVRIVLPRPGRLAADPAVLFCFPGGGMNKAYFDLNAEGDRSFSFAQAMAERGLITVAIDHLGVGASTQPEDGFLLHVDAVTLGDAGAVQAVKRLLHDGLPDYPALKSFTSIGVGHSMGGMLVSWVQSHHRPFDAVVILGSGPYGLYEHLIPDLRPLANDPMRARQEVVPRLRSAGVPPYLQLTGSPASRMIFGHGDRRGVSAVREARATLVTPCGFFVMIPGSWTPEAASLDVPVLLVFGDEDICKDPASVPAYFPGSPDVRLHLLPGTGHSHFVFESRATLFEEMARWVAEQSEKSVRAA